MPATASYLGIDLTGSAVRVLEGAMGGPMRCGSAPLPNGASAASGIKDPAAAGQALKQLLARTEILETRARVAVGDGLATFRILNLPPAATDKEVTAAVARELPLDPERIATRWIDVGKRTEQRLVYAAGWDRDKLKSVNDALKLAGIEAISVELKSACVARYVQDPSCIVVDLSSQPVELILIDEYLPRVWHNVTEAADPGQDLPSAIGGPLRSMLRFYRRSNGHFSEEAPVLIASEQELSGQVTERLSALVNQPVSMVAPPRRVPANVRHSTYLTCLGLIMRRR